MKRILFILFSIAIGTLQASADEDVFKKFANDPNVTYINVSKSVFKMMSSNFTVGEFDFGEFIELDNIRMLTCENDTLQPQIKKACEVFQKAPYEEFLDVKDENEKVSIYIIPSSDGKRIKEMILLLEELPDGDLTLIQLVGNMTIEELQSFTKDSD